VEAAEALGRFLEDLDAFDVGPARADAAEAMPSLRLRTQPSAPARRASSCVEPRKNTPCTRP
jgi:hypothetical protein